MQNSKPSTEPRQVVQNIVATALQLLQYGRLMLILFSMGVIVALAYYVYGRPIFFSRSLVRVTMLGLPLHSDSARDDTPGAGYRSLTDRLQSGALVLRTIQKLGFIRAGASPEEAAAAVIPTLRIDYVDGDTFMVNVYSYHPEVVRQFTQTLIGEFEASEREVRAEFREKALGSYLKELDDFKAQLHEQIKKRMMYEQENSLAELFIQQNSLTKVPKDIVMTKEHIRQMDEIRRYFTSQEGTFDVVAKLSLLSSFKLDEPVEVGTVTRGENGVLSSVVNEAIANKVVDVNIVQPSMVTPLTPWQILERRQREVKAELARHSSVYGPQHEVIVTLKRELSDVEDKLKGELSTAQKKFELDYARLQDKLKDLQSKIPEYNDVTSKYEQFRQDYSMEEKGQIEWDKAYASLAATVEKMKYGEGRDRLHLTFLGVQMIRDVDPVSPNKFKLVMIGLAIGLGLACGAPLAIQFFNTSASRVQEIEASTGLTGIGVVPINSTEQLESIFRSNAIDSRVPNHLLESFRIIRSQVLIRPNNQGQNQVIMVTSARPSEGKSTMAANIAWAFYSMGERTLLLDCDLRRGRVAKITGVKGSPGMTNLLIGKSTNAESIAKTQSELLDVIPRGPVIAGTTEVLCQPKFHDMIQEWRKHYDRIIIDAPPVLGLSETASLQQVADGVVLVVRAEVTRHTDVVAAVEHLRKAGAHIFGFVLNAVDLSKLTNYYYYYYYSPDYYGDFMPPDNEAVPA